MLPISKQNKQSRRQRAEDSLFIRLLFHKKNFYSGFRYNSKKIHCKVKNICSHKEKCYELELKLG